MKPIYLKFLCLTFIGCILASSCELDDSDGCDIKRIVEKHYEDDAHYLALQLMNATGFGNDVEIPHGIVDEALKALTAAQDLDNDESNDVFDKYEVGVKKNIDLKKISVEAFPSTPWVAEWLSGNQATGNNQVDNLMNAYDLELSEIINLSSGAIVALINAKRNLNTPALANRFQQISGVVSAIPQYYIGDGNDITITQTMGGYDLTFSVGYDVVDMQNEINNCEDFCDFKTFYNFQIIDCQVDSVYVTGDPAP